LLWAYLCCCFPLSVHSTPPQIRSIHAFLTRNLGSLCRKPTRHPSLQIDSSVFMLRVMCIFWPYTFADPICYVSNLSDNRGLFLKTPFSSPHSCILCAVENGGLWNPTLKEIWPPMQELWRCRKALIQRRASRPFPHRPCLKVETSLRLPKGTYLHASHTFIHA
jgi:hypothetical protein